METITAMKALWAESRGASGNEIAKLGADLRDTLRRIESETEGVLSELYRDRETAHERPTATYQSARKTG